MIPRNPNHTFYFHVDENHVIDALYGGNSSRWINHSCDPNCEAEEQDGRIFIKALRNIEAGEELNYDYGLIIDEPYTPKLKAEYPCWCGSQELPRHPAGAQAGAAQVNGATGTRNPAGCGAAGAGRSPAEAAQAVRKTLAPLLPGCAVEVVPELDSTNSELMRRARSGRAEPVLLVAQRQTAGRGRLGRAWHAEAGGALTFSLGLPLAPADWSGLSLAVGVALAERLHPEIRLKWPNDLWLRGRKLGGILIETASTGAEAGGARYAVIGAGINLAPPSAAGLATAPAWLGELLPQVQPAQVLLQVALPLVEAVLLFERAGFAAFRARFDARDALRGHRIVLSDGTAGTADGTNEQGALLVHTAGAVKTVTSSEVSVRPAAA